MNRATILCVDDEEIILTSLGEQLKRSFGKLYDIELASSGWEALEVCAELKAEGTQIPLVISDRTMPGMTGDEFLVRLHQTHPKTLKILLTGQASIESLGKIVNAAALYRYIAKPWDETDLILTVKEALRRHGQEEQLFKQNILLKRINQKLSQSLNLLLATFEAAEDGILVLDNRGAVVIFNRQFAELWQIPNDMLRKRSNRILELITERLAEPFASKLGVKNSQSGFQKYKLLELKNGKILETYFQTQKLDGKVVGVVWGFRDVTARERTRAIAEHQALHDTLTQLPKRTILTYQLTQAITKAEREAHKLVVMIVNLGRFKAIKDTLGHQASDRLLKLVVDRLENCIRNEDLIGRWESNEFTILLPQINSQKDVNAIAERILNALKTPFYLDNKPVYATGNIGIAVYPDHGEDADSLIRNADVALTQGQEIGNNNYQYFNPSLCSQAHKLFAIENLLHSALKKGEFLLYYQPIINSYTGKIAKMEALIRWNNSQIGTIPPNIFIPIAEKNGEILSIGEWVLETACRQNKAWQDMGLREIKMSVNLSVRQLQKHDLISIIFGILSKTKLAANFLELEITENIAMNDELLVNTIFSKLSELEISLAVDDFGTGYSSFGYLKNFPFRTLKIDRSLVKDLPHASQDLAIINAITTLAKGLNLDVVAEGVETKEQRELLTNLGCKYLQGYLFSKPLPAAEAAKLLQQHHFN